MRVTLHCKRPAKRTRLSEHVADRLRHLVRGKGSQRFGANIAKGTETQRERHEGGLVWRIDDRDNVISSLRPDEFLHSHSERLRHCFEGFRALWRLLGVADSLICEIRQHDIGYHGRPPRLGTCTTGMRKWRRACHSASGEATGRIAKVRRHDLSRVIPATAKAARN